MRIITLGPDREIPPEPKLLNLIKEIECAEAVLDDYYKDLIKRGELDEDNFVVIRVVADALRGALIFFTWLHEQHGDFVEQFADEYQQQSGAIRYRLNTRSKHK